MASKRQAAVTNYMYFTKQPRVETCNQASSSRYKNIINFMKNTLVRFQSLVQIPVLDHLISEIRFNSRTSSLVTEVMQLLPPQIAKCDLAITPNELTEFRAVYDDILPDPLSLDTELH